MDPHLNGNGGSPQPAPQQPQIPMMPLRSIPTILTLQTDEANKQVRLICSTPMGFTAYVLDPDAAEKVGNDMINHARMARSGLVVPVVQPPPNLKGLN